MNVRKRQFLHETAIATAMMSGACAYYYTTIWGTADWYAEGPFKDYVTGAGLLSELIITALGLGLLLSVINRLSESSRVRRWSFGRIVLFKSALFVLGLAVVVGLVQLVLWQVVLSPEEMREAMGLMSLPLGVSVGSWIVLSALGVNFLLEVRRKVGPGNLTALVTGRYQRPRSEDILFLFVDLKSSTTIAESLGHREYSEFIQSCFHDLSDAVIQFGASIYQYVGDEAVLTWPAEGRDAQVSCIDTYFAFQRRLDERRGWYEGRFGVAPEFRAGVEAGPVTVAEVGDVKREIAYHGDPLNTAARLLELCKEYDQQILVSQGLTGALADSGAYSTTWQGDVTLRGKSDAVSVYGVVPVPR